MRTRLYPKFVLPGVGQSVTEVVSRPLTTGVGVRSFFPHRLQAALPSHTDKWDVHPYKKGVNRGSERVVTGSDGSSYYTQDHYMTFVRTC